MTKVAIVGSRTFPHARDAVSAYLADLPLPGTEIVSGGAPGVDTLAEEYATMYGMKTTVFEAQWNVYGAQAGPKRNILIVDYADRVVAFWDGESKGTHNTIKLALKAKKNLEVIFP